MEGMKQSSISILHDPTNARSYVCVFSHRISTSESGLCSVLLSGTPLPTVRKDGP
jgi:hypothetical protein